MELLFWNHFKNDNKKLINILGDEIKNSNLSFSDGFFISPDDYINRENKLSKILLNKSINDLIKENNKYLFLVIEKFYDLIGGFDRLDYKKFKQGLKVAYFLAISNYIYTQNIKDLINIKPLYKPENLKLIEKNFSQNLTNFIDLAKNKNKKINIYPLFQFGIELILETSKNIQFSEEFKNLNTFLKSPKFSPNSNLIGELFEKEIQLYFEKNELKEEISKLILTKTKQNGVLLALDEDKEFKKIASKKAQGIAIPDYIFITSKNIIPIDLKVNLNFAKEKQIDKNNLKILFEKTYDKIKIIFSNLTIEGIKIENK